MTEAAAVLFSPMRVVLMGVSGCGKSTVGEGLAARMGWRFVEGDSLHPTENVAKMAAGQPLDDADRAGWLTTLADLLDTARQDGQGLVVSCSALKRAYRDRLRTGDPQAVFVHLDGSRDVIAERIAGRTHMYMPASLLESQFAALELPQADEQALTLSVLQPPAELIRNIAQHLQAQTCPTP
ncbi:MAG: gluconokinase [Limnohabitans sp.]